jgi:hypothetical protein
MIEKITMRQIQDEYYKVNEDSQKDSKPKLLKSDTTAESSADQKLLSPTNILPPSPLDMISMPSPEANLLVEESAVVHVKPETPTTISAEKSVSSIKIINQ